MNAEGERERQQWRWRGGGRDVFNGSDGGDEIGAVKKGELLHALFVAERLTSSQVEMEETTITMILPSFVPAQHFSSRATQYNTTLPPSIVIKL